MKLLLTLLHSTGGNNLWMVLVVLIVVGIALYLINRFVPMVAWIKTLINIIAIIFVIFWLLKVFGVIEYLRQVTI